MLQWNWKKIFSDLHVNGSLQLELIKFLICYAGSLTRRKTVRWSVTDEKTYGNLVTAFCTNCITTTVRILKGKHAKNMSVNILRKLTRNVPLDLLSLEKMRRFATLQQKVQLFPQIG